MEELIKTIIDVDKKARNMADESKKQLIESKIAIEQRVKELEEQYDKSVDEIIELTTEDENQKIKEQMAKIDEQYKSANDALDKKFEQNKEKLVQTLIERSLAD